MSRSKIGWLKNSRGVEDAAGDLGTTWGVIRGCSRVSPGCGGGAPGREEGKHGGCYAERHGGRFCGEGRPDGPMAGRRLPFYGYVEKNAQGEARWTGKVTLVPDELAAPLGWQKPTVAFISMSDIFHEALPFEEIGAIFAIVAYTGLHTFKFLTKRSKRMVEFFAWLDREAELVPAPSGVAPAMVARRMYVLDTCLRTVVKRYDIRNRSIARLQREIPITVLGGWPLPNLHLGVSVELADYVSRIDDLRQVPAVARIVSFEPLLGPIGKVDLTDIDQAIAGAESGPGARRWEEAWFAEILDACRSQNVPHYLKQYATESGKKILEPILHGRTWTEPTRVHHDRVEHVPTTSPPIGDPA